MKYEVKDLNAPSRWNMRIWDDDNGEWLCQSDKNALTYYGFDITGGEITEFQGLPKWHTGRHLIWEQSTGLKDKNGQNIYEGDIVLDYYDEDDAFIVEWDKDTASFILTDTKWGVSDEATKLLTAEEWEKERKYHLFRAKVGKSKSSEQWLKEHHCSEELLEEEYA